MFYNNDKWKEFKIGDIVNFKGGLYRLEDNKVLQDITYPFKDKYSDENQIQRYSLELVKQELIAANAKNLHLLFYVKISKNILPIFIRKAIDAGFNCDNVEINQKAYQYFILDRDDCKKAYTCNVIGEGDLYYYRGNMFTYRLQEEHITNLDTNYIIFKNFDNDYRFEVTQIKVEMESQPYYPGACWVKPPVDYTANVTIKLTGNQKFDNELQSHLYQNARYDNARAEVHFANNLCNPLEVNLLTSISSVGSFLGYDSIDLVYATAHHIENSDEMREKLNQMVYDNTVYRDSQKDGVETAMQAMKKVEEEYRLKQKYKELGLDKIDIDSLFEGINYNYEPDNQAFVTFNKADAELQYKMYNKENEKENNIMKINNKDLKQIIIDEDRKTVTTITTDTQSDMARMFQVDAEKHVTVAKASDGDEFDPYVGVAMTLVYQLFGSKEEFRKFVRENEVVKNLKKEREAREAAKKEAQEKAEQAKKRAAARKAKRTAKRDEHDEKIATAVLSKLVKFIDKTSEKTETKDTKKKKKKDN